MPRINVEEKWWSDARRDLLIELAHGRIRADGIALNAWRVAQQYCRRDDGLIPQNVFKKLDGAAFLLEADLAEVRGDRVYVKGTEAVNEWLISKAVAGRSGGLAKASRVIARAKHEQGTSLASVSVSVSGSISESREPNTLSLKSDDLRQRDQLFEQFYQEYPKKVGKKRARKTFDREIKTGADRAALASAILKYREHCANEGREKQYVMQFDTFMKQWRDWTAPDAGTAEELKRPKEDFSKFLTF